MDHSQPLERRLNTPPVRVLVVGQTPPPYHGQAIMIQMLVEGPVPDVQLHHVRMQFSESLGEIGKVKFAKITHLFWVIAKILWTRIRYQATVLYYPPAGPNRVPLVRDAVILLTTRWLFSKTVFHFHSAGCSELIPQLRNPLRWLVLRALNAPDVAIELSEYGPRDGAFLNAKTVACVSNGIQDEASQFPREPEHDGNEPPRILYLGTVSEEKGVSILLAACSILKETKARFYLDIVGGFGSEAYKQRLESEILNLQLEDFVHLHGQKVGPDKWKMFSIADIFCFPSHYECEAFPCVLLEALSFRLPIVATRWRGIPSIVSHGENGLLVPTQDVQAVASCLKELMDAPELRHKMGIEGRRRFEQEFTHVKFLERMRGLFLSLV
ncbi:glycosyltransferase [Pirellulaceae bacterium SH467]